MTQQNSTELYEIIQEGLKKDEDFMKAVMETVLQRVLEQERDRQIGADSYEMNGERSGSMNGYKMRKLKTMLGELHLRKPP
jgi:transposase-like protein